MSRVAYPIDARLLRLPRRRVLLCEPHTWAYGHLGLEILYALHAARALGARLYLIRPRSPVNEALYHVTTPGVREHHPSLPWSPLVGFAWWCAGLLTRARDGVVRLLRPHIRRVAKAIPFLSPEARRGVVRRLEAGLRTAKQQRAAHRDGPYFQRRLLLEALPTRLCPEFERVGRELAEKAGIAPQTRLVTLHVREAGYRLGREHHERKQSARVDSVRNADIETCLAAVDYLVGLGYTVVRIGDPTMAPLERRGVVDVAHWQEGRDVMDVYCLLRSDFILGCESGPTFVVFLTGTPSLLVNGTDPISSYPVRDRDILVLKHVRERETGRFLSLNELVEEEYLSNLRNAEKYEYVGNTSEEIVAAVREMIALLSSDPPPETDRQRVFRELATRAALDLRDRLGYVRKWGADAGFLGEGRIAGFFADAHLSMPPGLDASTSVSGSA